MKIICLGDSLTEGLGIAKVNAWPAVLQNELSVEIINKGISGDTSTGMLSRFYHDVVLNNPSHVIICSGGNDLWWNVDLNYILSNIYSMVKQAIHNNIQPIIAIHPPIHLENINHKEVWEPIAGFETFVLKAKELAERIEQMIEINHFNLIDFRIPFQQHQQLKTEFFEGTDGVHPNELGHIALAKQAYQTMKEF
ncbi:GDSL-type esterase/lipase family protein [Bacillus sp. AFS017336]|uniref:GDSL-type esterase/lipase family protein n=1 Tax=Bacillus sp. AFS017336 TaxID=2033489 RepID=UPI000BF0BEB6|nr:GDSL-type esterase/lipase family protein [Bacillus sp. AFS017336]PEL09906.1 lysophospholipase [Bacillus sp. AFS017336]